MCTEQLPPGGYPIAVKYIISYYFPFIDEAQTALFKDPVCTPL
jgi:hypothetical protein